MKKKLIFPVLAAAVLSICLWPHAAFDENSFAVRRDRLRIMIGGQAVLYSGREETIGLDKNFYYLTGLAVSDGFLLLSSESRADKLFLDPAASPISGEDIVRASGIVNAFPRDLIGLFLAAGLAFDPDVYFPSVYQPSDPAYLYPSYLVIEQLLAGMPYVRRNNLVSLLASLRMVKDGAEIGLIAQASDITGRGLVAGVSALRPGMLESDLQEVIEETFRSLGAPRTSFPSIVGSGPNSLILHYEENTRRMNAGDVVAVDVGAEFGRYAGDITRTLPVSGVFTPRQREVYEVVLECQRRVIEACRPGVTLANLNTIATTCAAEYGYGAFVNFADWRHTTCHSLGLDVHDPFLSYIPLSPGMVITVEPGIYLPAENLGVRIEDDVLITSGAPVILSSVVPRTPDAIEALMTGFNQEDGKKGRDGGNSSAGRRFERRNP